MGSGRRIAVMLLALAPAAKAAPAPELWEFWDTAEPASHITVDHGPWQLLLDRYVSRGADAINRVGYARFSSPDRTRLDNYVNALVRLDPRTLDEATQMAYWINLYNAITVRVVLDHPRKAGIRRMGGGLFSFGPWDDELVTIAGKAVTLNDIEHRILRPVFQDHRVHYALNCASLGCPNLSQQAYTPQNLQQLLDAGERAYVNHPRGVDLQASGGLTVSSIYDWYRVDFASNDRELLEYLARHHEALAGRLRTYDGKVDFAYDWTLNSETPR
jgi:hypothetical protein